MIAMLFSFYGVTGKKNKMILQATNMESKTTRKKIIIFQNQAKRAIE
jgi:hypothetical protein